MGLDRFRLIGIFIVLVVSLAVGLTVNAGAESAYTWNGVDTIIESEMKFPYDTPNNVCRYSVKYVDLYPEMLDQRLCSQTNDGNVFGSLIRNGLSRYYFGQPNDQLYPFESPGCQDYDSCLYIPQKDMLVSLERRNGGMFRSLVIYKNFSSRITFNNTAWNKQSKTVHYSFDVSGPDYVFEDPNTKYAWSVLSVGASANGEWLAVAFYERGLGLLNLATLEMKWVSSEVRYTIGYGYDPSPELAVSDTGKNILAVGSNAGFSLIDIDEECGEDPIPLWPTYTTPSKKFCPRYVLDLSRIIERYREAYKPKFYDNGGRMSFSVLSYLSISKGVVIRHPDIRERAVNYIALGDSYSSGEGETDDSRYLAGTNIPLEKCHVSDRSYPFLFITLIGIPAASARNVACSGAKTIDVSGEGNAYLGQKDLQKKLQVDIRGYALMKYEALTSFIPGRQLQESFTATHRPQIATIGIGGNDVGLMELMKACIMPGTCEFAHPGPLRYGVAKQVQGLYSVLIRLYGKIIADSPGTKLAVIGYPDPFGTEGQCSLVLNTMLDNEEREFFRSTIRYLNQIMADAARKVGVQYVDTWSAYGEHALCGPLLEKAVRHIVLGDDIGIFKDSRWFNIFGKESFHPTPLGHQLVAQTIARQVPYLAYSTCPGGYYICPMDTSTASTIDAYWKEGVPSTILVPELRQLDIAEDSTHRGSSLSVDIPSGVLSPNSVVDIELHSEPLRLGSWTTDSDGRLKETVTIPDTVPAGIHTLHIYGISTGMSDINIYDVVALDEAPIPDKVPEMSQVVSSEGEALSSAETEEKTLITTTPSGVSSVADILRDVSVGAMKPGVLNLQSRDQSTNLPVWLYYVAAAVSGIVIVSVLLYRKKRIR